MICFKLPILLTRVSSHRYQILVVRTMFRAMRGSLATATFPIKNFAVPTRISSAKYVLEVGYFTSKSKRADGEPIDFHPKLIETIDNNNDPFIAKGTCMVLGTFTKKPLKNAVSFVFSEDRLLKGDLGKPQYLVCPLKHIYILDPNAFRVDSEMRAAINTHPHVALVGEYYRQLLSPKAVIWIIHRDTNANILKSHLINEKNIPKDEEIF